MKCVRPRRFALASLALGMLVLLGPLPAGAQPQAAAPAYPSRAVRILVGSPPGGPADTVARLFAEQLGLRLKRPVIIESRPGMANSLAAGIAAKSVPDGHTLVLSPDTVLTVNPLAEPKLLFDPRTELVNISLLASFTQMLVCKADRGIRSAGELADRSRAQRLRYASGGAGSPGHLATEMFLQATGGKLVHVSYRGPVPAVQAVLSGEVDSGFLPTATVLPYVKSGALVALAVSSATPSPLAPEVPTLAMSLNQPALDISFQLVLQSARGLPAPVLATLERAAMEIMRQPELRAKLQALDLVPVGSSTQEAEALLRAEATRWEPVVKRLALRPE
jgi:tripartite-type tricarboxylate transporter receptor subunit TctC